MTDVNELFKPGHNDGAAPMLDAFTRKHHNSVKLIRYLREVEYRGVEKAPQLDPMLAKLLADILDGTLPNVKVKAPWSLISRNELRGTLKVAKELIAEGDPDVLEHLGLKYPPDTKGEIAKLAMKLSGRVYGIGQSAFEGRLHPRKGRNKKG